jgi:hypothetical protein
MAEDANVPTKGPTTDQDEERRRLVRDIAYAQLVLDEARRLQERPRSRFARLARALSHGLVILLVGSGLTSVLVPWIQRRHQERQARVEARKECLAQFLLYANSRWPEYYVVLPLVVRGSMTPDDYRESLRHITVVKVARYDAAAKIEARLLAFRRKIDEKNEDVENAFAEYQKTVNGVSERIDIWLRNAYCYSNVCQGSVSDGLDPEFEPYTASRDLQQSVIELLQADAYVTEQFVKHLEDD